MAHFEDYYEILQVSSSAEPEVVEAAYKKLAQKYHPDINTGPLSSERMTKINIARDILSDPVRRAQYHAQWLHERDSLKSLPETYIPATPKPSAYAAYSEEYNPVGQTRRGKKVGIIASIVVVLLVVGVIIFALSKNSGFDLGSLTSSTAATSITPATQQENENTELSNSAPNRWDEAIVEFTRAIELNPKDAEAYNNRGLIYQDKGDYDRALADFSRAIEIDPKGGEVYVNRGFVYHIKGDYDKALADYTRAIELNPKDAKAYSYRGDTCIKKGRYDDAIADCSKAIGLEPNYVKAYQFRGAAYYFKGDVGKAQIDYKKAQELGYDEKR